MTVSAAYVTALVALQFVAFGWRINREISVGDEGRKAWLPAPDLINILSLVSVTWFCILQPFIVGPWLEVERGGLSAGYVLIAFHPISEAAHYELWFTAHRRSYRWCPKQELFCVVLSLVLALAAGLFAFYGISK